MKRHSKRTKKSSKAIEQEAMNCYTNFPAQGEYLLIGVELEAYYIGLYDGMKVERDGIDCVPLRSFNKVEMFKNGLDQKQSSEEYILPVATKRINGDFHVKHGDSKHVFNLKFPNRWNYFRLNPSSEIVKYET